MYNALCQQYFCKKGIENRKYSWYKIYKKSRRRKYGNRQFANQLSPGRDVSCDPNAFESGNGKNGTAQWKATLSGSFTYTGSSATCTSSSVDVTVYDSSWYTISKSSNKSGSKATASVTMGEKLAGVTVTKVPISLAMTCDKNGNLS